MQRPHAAVVFLPLLLLLLVGFLPRSSSIPDPRVREALIQLEASMGTGGDVMLTEQEQKLNARLVQMMQEEMMRDDFPPAMHFFRARELIRSSPLFGLLEKMPKGAALHVHDFSMVDVEWLVKNVTYRPQCYMCVTDRQSMRFVFAGTPPKPLSHCSSWILLERLRAQVGNHTDLDNSIMGNLTLFTHKPPEATYPTQDVVWQKFEDAFLAASGLIRYAPVFRDYFYQGLLQFHADNVMYVEVRAMLPQIYELDGCLHDRAWTLTTYQQVTNLFKSDYPDFFDAKIILSAHRGVNASMMVGAVEDAMKLQQDFPHIMAGFDLVGREDTGGSLWYFREALSLPAERQVKLPFFFHAGETDGHGTEVDQNMLDAILFNTSRIGHGFALPHHPLAKDLSRKRGIAVEVCPISNQVLMLVKDLRDHPASVLMAENHPLVISSDDPSMFGSSGLSYDFYEAFVGIAGGESQLGFLKELAINSIRFSSLSPPQQEKALTMWERRWSKFVSENSF